MKAKLYIGISNPEQSQYFIIRNMDYDISGIVDESGLPYKLKRIIICKGEIKSWNPFLADYKDYTGIEIQKIFICPVCGSKSCERPNHNEYADPYFFQGNFKCSKCGYSNFNFYSKCFHKKIKQSQQLSFF